MPPLKGDVIYPPPKNPVVMGPTETLVIFVHHGEADHDVYAQKARGACWNDGAKDDAEDYIYTLVSWRHNPPALTPSGIGQVMAIVKELGDFHVRNRSCTTIHHCPAPVIVTSPLRRAIQTTELIDKQMTKEIARPTIVVRSRFRERTTGTHTTDVVLAGEPHATRLYGMESKLAGMIEKMDGTDWTIDETTNGSRTLYERALEAIDYLRKIQGVVIVVTHHQFMKALAEVLRQPLPRGAHENAGVWIPEMDPDAVNVGTSLVSRILEWPFIPLAARKLAYNEIDRLIVDL